MQKYEGGKDKGRFKGWYAGVRVWQDGVESRVGKRRQKKAGSHLGTSVCHIRH